MKRHPLILSSLLLLLCCLLCACSAAPITQPPGYSLMTMGSLVALENRQVAYKFIRTVHYGAEAEYYELLLESGVENLGSFKPEGSVDYGKLSYKHYTAALNTLIAQLQQDDMGMSYTGAGNFTFYYQPGMEGWNQKIAAKAPDAPDDTLRYTGYYVYSISQKTLVRGDGQIVGEDTWGWLDVYNQNPFSPETNREELEYCCVLIAD